MINVKYICLKRCQKYNLTRVLDSVLGYDFVPEQSNLLHCLFTEFSSKNKNTNKTTVKLTTSKLKTDKQNHSEIK